MSRPEPRATVLITTRDRAGELPRALDSVLAQNVPLDVVVVDDGSTDDTSAVVRRRYPQVRLQRNESPLGIVGARQRASASIRTEILFTLDDDAVFRSPDCVRRTLELFGPRRVAAVTLPLVSLAGDDRIETNMPRGGAAVMITAKLRGGANAMRLPVFREVGGYPSAFVTRFEETDYCLRLLDRGYVVRLGDADPVDHYLSPRRDWAAIAYYSTRNRLLVAWLNVPSPYVAAELLVAPLNQVLAQRRRGLARHAIRGLVAGLRAIARGAVTRTPISAKAYRLSRRLVRGGPIGLDELGDALPAFVGTAPPLAVVLAGSR